MKSVLRAIGAYFLLVGGAVGLFGAGSSDAHEVTFDFTGTFVAADPHSLGGINSPSSLPGFIPDSTITGSFTFDAETGDANTGDHHVGQYNGSIGDLSFSVTHTGSVLGGLPPYQFTFNSGGPLNSIQVNADHTPANQSYIVSASVQNLVPAGPIVDGDNYFARDFFINLTKPVSEIFTTDGLPELPPDHSLFSLYSAATNPNGQFRLILASTHGDHTLFGNLTSLTVSAVPVPAAVYLFGTGLIGLASFARRTNGSIV